MKRLTFILISAWLGIGSGCNRGSSAGDSDARSDKGTSSSTALVTSNGGGTISQDGLQATVPAGAYKQDVRISSEKVAPQRSADGTSALGDGFALSVKTLEGEKVRDLEKPVEVSLSAALPSNLPAKADVFVEIHDPVTLALLEILRPSSVTAGSSNFSVTFSKSGDLNGIYQITVSITPGQLPDLLWRTEAKISKLQTTAVAATSAAISWEAPNSSLSIGRYAVVLMTQAKRTSTDGALSDDALCSTYGTSLAKENTSKSFADLSPSTAYYAGICVAKDSSATPVLSKSVNILFTTSPGGTATATATPTPASPGDPSGLTLTPTSQTAISVGWTAGTGSTTGHRLAWKLGSTAPVSCTSDTAVSSSTMASSVTYPITGLSTGNTVSVRVCSVNSAAVESTGVTGSAITLVVAPNDPTGPGTAVNSSSEITVSWTSGGGSTSAFKIAYQTASAPASCAVGTIISSATVGSVTSYKVRGLAESTLYGFRVCAVNTNPTPDVSAGITSTATTSAAGVACDSGTLDTTCTITSTKTLGNGTTIAGAGNIVVANNGNLTATGTNAFTISMVGNVTVQSGGKIIGNLTQLRASAIDIQSGGEVRGDAHGSVGGTNQDAGTGTAPGQPVNCTAGAGGSGGSHAGFGSAGVGSAGGTAGYGVLDAPTTLGSGGGAGCGAPGGAGGGRVTILADVTMVVNGSLTSNGENANPSIAGSNGSGGGAGGSLWITAPTITGAGTISANGGTSGTRTTGGGGGGGRVAMIYDAMTGFSGQVQAIGGAGLTAGGAGTIYKKINGSLPTLTISGGSTVGANSFFDLAGVYTFATVTVTNNARLFMTGTQAMTINNMDVTSTGAIYHDGLGYTGTYNQSNGNGTSPGQGTNCALVNGGGGGSHGGLGGNGSSAGGASPYGVFDQPVTLGSAGGAGCDAYGGNGGGALKFQVIQTLTLNGSISANGMNGTRSAVVGTPNDSGGGAGGSIWILTSTLTGAGTISAKGGNSSTDGLGGVGTAGGGGGGLIALTYTDKTNFSGTILATGGVGKNPGGAGLVFLLNSGVSNQLIVDNASGSAGRTPIDLTYNLSVDKIIVRNSGRLFIWSARLTPASAQIMTIGAIDVLATASIDHSFAGDAGGGNQGPGSGIAPGGGANCANGAGGGAHGGNGGNGTQGAGGAAYGSASAPITFGSGGGGGCAASSSGGYGGGAFKITVTGTIAISGTITASGQAGEASTTSSGGGAGGSIWLIANSITGSGTISAIGGNGATSGGNTAGGGGGGRIKLQYNTMPVAPTIAVAGGAGVNNGSAGSIQ